MQHGEARLFRTRRVGPGRVHARMQPAALARRDQGATEGSTRVGADVVSGLQHTLLWLPARPPDRRASHGPALACGVPPVNATSLGPDMTARTNECSGAGRLAAHLDEVPPARTAHLVQAEDAKPHVDDVRAARDGKGQQGTRVHGGFRPSDHVLNLGSHVRAACVHACVCARACGWMDG